MSITERVILSVKGGVDEWKDALKVMLQTLKARDGYLRTRYFPSIIYLFIIVLRLYELARLLTSRGVLETGDTLVGRRPKSSPLRWGPHSEDQQTLEILIVWEPIEAPIKFQASPAFQDMLYQIAPVLAAAPKIIVIEFKPYAPKEVIDAHLVHMLTIEQGAASEDDLRDEVTKFKDLEGCTGVASGISSDDVDGKEKSLLRLWGGIAWKQVRRLRLLWLVKLRAIM
ncbi:hypothetical protein DID88_009561 [Monilinia fructigena]|uniref:Uncharacterized protein n=1 Tax=Monilinia fructigena TaxID=38457 RepID=A0A395IMJ3_9HELO|nr:hypothetical protein DID88_009561 [Monilinia fructigena]